MWMWPLNSVMGATAAHRAPERVADGTCTRVWAWMTNKCRRRMNGREGYITTEITQSRRGIEEKEGLEKGERLLGCERSWEFPSSGEGSFLPGTLGRPILCIFHPQNKPSPHQSPTFGPILYKFIVLGLLGLSSFTSTMKDLPKVDPIVIFCVVVNFSLFGKQQNNLDKLMKNN